MSSGHKVPADQDKGPAPQAQLRQKGILISENFHCIPGEKPFFFFFPHGFSDQDHRQVQMATGSRLKSSLFFPCFAVVKVRKEVLPISRLFLILLGEMRGNCFL